MAEDRYPRNEDGSIDWEQHRLNEVATGNRCKNPDCDTYILNLSLFGKKVTHAQECYDCREMAQKTEEEVTHDNLLRCPKCGHTQQASEEWEAGIYRSDEEPVCISCNECDHEYEVMTRVSYSFTSPAMKEKEDESTCTTEA